MDTTGRTLWIIWCSGWTGFWALLAFLAIPLFDRPLFLVINLGLVAVSFAAIWLPVGKLPKNAEKAPGPPERASRG